MGTIGAVWLIGAGASADEVQLTTGETLSGTVTSQDDQRVHLTHPILGDVALPRDQVTEIRIEQAPGEDGAVAEQQAVRSDAARRNREAPKGGLFGTGLLDTWDHRLGFGFNGRSGNVDRLSVNASYRGSYEDKDTRWLIESGYFYAQDSANTTQNEFSARLTRDWLLDGSQWFYFLRGGYEYDEFETWEQRASVFGGVGYTFVREDNFEFAGRAGLGGNYEFGDVNQFNPEALFGASLIRWNLTDTQTLTAEATLFPSLDELGEFRLVTSADWQVQIDRGRGLSLKFGVVNEYESDPAGDDENNDFKYYGALVFEF